MLDDITKKVGAIVLAAGMSKRMGQAKMILPYRGSTVLGTVLTALNSAGVTPLIAVTGGGWEMVEPVIRQQTFPVHIARNPHPDRTEMLDSLRIGMDSLPEDSYAFLIVLGDQPQIQPKIISRIIAEFNQSGAPLIVPSYQMRRGHPWLIGRTYWMELKTLGAQQTLRDFLRKHNDQIHYLEVDSSTILEDLDTPEDYQRALGKELN